MQRIASRSVLFKRFIGSGKELMFGVEVLQLYFCVMRRLVMPC